jgi:hypothetical protein
MNVGELFRRLSYGEFNDHFIGMEGAGTIEPTHQDKVISHINTALTEIFSKFSHKRDYVKVRLYDGVFRYPLTSDYAVSNTDPLNTNTRFILDSEESPFQNDIIKILGTEVLDDPVTLENEAQSLSLNRRNTQDPQKKIQTLDYRTLYVPDPVDGRVIEIEYQAGHAELTIPADLTEEINIHPVLESALEAHVAYQSFGSMASELHLAKSRILWGRYQQICDRVEMEDLLQETDNSEIDRLRDKGFI